MSFIFNYSYISAIGFRKVLSCGASHALVLWLRGEIKVSHAYKTEEGIEETMQLGVTLLLSVEWLCSRVEYGLVTQGAQAHPKLALT